MKKSILFLFIFIQAISVNILFCCPQGFSSTDQRPFFEQYDPKNSSNAIQEKEKQ